MEPQFIRSFIGLFAIACLAVIGGCESKKVTDSKASERPLAADEHRHADGSIHKGSHADTQDEKEVGHEEGHVHGAGPNGGAIADWGGGKFHVEFTVDHNKKESTVYVFGSDEKTATPIDATEIVLAIKEPAFHLNLKAVPQENDPQGTSSRFVGTHESLAIVREFEGSISGSVNGTPYSGNFKEVAQGD